MIAFITRRSAWCWFAGYFALGLGYIVLTPPLRAPDERNHFFRAYQVSELRNRAERRSPSIVGDYLPASIVRMSDALGDATNNRVTSEQWVAARAIRSTERREFLEFSTAPYAPLAYAPAAMLIAFGRSCGARPLVLLYLARFANLVAGSLLVTAALKRAGYARTPLLVIACFPMVLSQISTVTADAISFATAFLALALFIDTALRADPISRGRIVSLALIALSLSQLRPPYPLLSLVALVVLFHHANTRRIAAVMIVLTLSVVPAIAWNMHAARVQEAPENGQVLDPAKQVRWIAKYPGPFLHRVKHDLRLRGSEYWEELVGRLGWFNIHLPPWITLGFGIAFIGALGASPPQTVLPRAGTRAYLVCFAIAGVIATEATLYVTFNSVGSNWIFGVQGRYFVPSAALLAFAAASPILSRRITGRHFMAIFAAFAIAAHATAFTTLYHSAH